MSKVKTENEFKFCNELNSLGKLETKNGRGLRRKGGTEGWRPYGVEGSEDQLLF